MVTRNEMGTLLIATITKRAELEKQAKAETKLNRQLNAIAIISAIVVIVGTVLGGISN